LAQSSEERIDAFLAALPSSIRKSLTGQSLTWKELRAVTRKGWLERYGQAHEEYLELLRQCPSRLRAYRKQQVDFTLSLLPPSPRGAPREDIPAQEAQVLQQKGLSESKIARKLNRMFPNRTDKKGNTKPFTPEGVRKLLQRRRRSVKPDKN
jgi:hypothetical protein